MAAVTIQCAKLKQELPAIDPATPEGDQALKIALLIGGRDMQNRIRQSVSAKAWEMWRDHMRMIINEYRLDPTSDQANAVIRPHMEAFFFGEQKEIDNYVPPKS